MPTALRAHRVLRNLGLALLACSIWLFLPERSDAQCLHGVSIFKTCVSPKNLCGSNADCADPNSCSGQGICTTTGDDNIIECTITLTNNDQCQDDIRVNAATDNVFAASGTVTFPNLPISSTSGTVSGDCTGPIDPTIGCTLDFGASVSFLSNQYVIQPADPDPLPDQAQVVVQDLCNVVPTGCSTTPNTVQFTASTDLVSGCLPGPTCTPTPTATNTATPTATNTPTNTPTGVADTPTNTPTPPETVEVPTLSFPMLAMLGLLLAGLGLFLMARRH